MNRIFVILSLSLFSLCCAAQTAKQSVQVPEWVKDAVFYQIFPERFANGDPSNDPLNVEAWGDTPKTNNYFGGDLKGVIDHLDYLQRLGINAIYFNPVFESNSNHKYHTSDYMKIDHNFGDEKTFQLLMDECHKRGMRVVIDAVFNHSGIHFFAFEDIKKNEKNSKYLNWYNVHSFPVSSPEKPNYEAWWGLGDLPKLMTDNPEVRKYLFDATSYWTKMGLDGWRLDVPNEIKHDFWIEWRKLVKGINPDVYIVGEIWDDATPWLKGDQFDAVMNYRFRGACVGYFALDNLNAYQFDSILAKTRSDYPVEVTDVLQNLIGSHDTERFLTLSNGNLDKLKLAALVQMTYVGAPMVYYGDEIGMTGGKDPDCRKTMVWDSTKWNMDLFTWYQKIIGIRNDYPVFRRGSFRTLISDSKNNVFGFKRELGDQSAVVIVNNSGSLQTVPLNIQSSGNITWTNLINQNKVTAGNIDVPAWSGVVLVSEKGK